MVLLAGVDPLKYIQEILLVFVGFLVLSIVYVYWNRFVFLLTGDDRIHLSSLDVIYFVCFRCCGCCTGEWTRCLSRSPCCPRRLRGKNLVKAFGQMIGWATHSIEIKNIIVGEIPFDQGRGDFYLSVEASTNPPMVTALQEEKLPKVVHFPEIIGLKIRDSALEKRVRICVKELNMIGSVDVCDVFINSGTLIDWSAETDPDKRVKRIQMRCIDNDIERETPPWILLEIAEADDVRGIDSLPNGNEGGMFVRTWVPTDHESVKVSGAQPVAYTQNPGGMMASNNMWGMGAARQNVDMQVQPFKHTYTLLDDAGNPVAEPDESKLAALRRMRMCAVCLFGLFQTVVWSGVLFWLGFRFYVWSCYRQFRWLTQAKLRQAQFPISVSNLKEYVKDCSDKFDGTGVTTGTGNALADACRPSDATIIETCTALPNGQPRPEAFTMLVQNQLGIPMKHGFKCFDGICAFRNKVAQYDMIIVALAVVLILSTFCCKWGMNSCIKSYRRAGQKEQTDKQKQALTAVAGRR